VVDKSRGDENSGSGEAAPQEARSMTRISLEADAHRIRVEGVCRETDLELIEDAVAAFRQLLTTEIIVDLTAVTELSGEVAEFLLQAQASAEGGAHINLIRRLGDPADLALAEAGH
jgi:hypothetical protein